MRSCLQPNDFFYFSLNIFDAISGDVSQLPFAHFQRIAFLHYFFDVVFELSGQDLSCNFAPLGLSKFNLHGVDLNEFLLESGLHLGQFSCKHCFFLLHILLNILVRLLKGSLEDLLNFLFNVSELIAQNSGHSGVEEIDL